MFIIVYVRTTNFGRQITASFTIESSILRVSFFCLGGGGGVASSVSSTSTVVGAAAFVAGGSGVSAKKRWLRQAISEEPTNSNVGATSPGHTPGEAAAGDALFRSTIRDFT